jgi:hypothetical protein
MITAAQARAQAKIQHETRIVKAIRKASDAGLLYCIFKTLSQPEKEELKSLGYQIKFGFFGYTVSWRGL